MRWTSIRFRGILLAIPFLVDAATAQEYLWPTDASRLMTSSFGEYRPGHFHAGMDIKTWGREGYRVFAIADGSVVRVRVSPFGYGRAVYLRLDNGMVVVYAHLSRFSDSIREIIKAEQERRGRYAVQKYFQPGRLPVKRGDVLGYTGSSGNGVPHLHIDVRDTLSRPFNPLLLGFPVEDTIFPTIRKLSVSPLAWDSHVEGDALPRVYPATRRRKGRYRLDSPVIAWGELGFAVSAFDQADGAWNRFSPYALRMIVDDTLVFAVRYDRFSFEKTEQVDLDRDYRLRRWNLGHFQKLYRDVGNTLDLYRPDTERAGLLRTRDPTADGPGDASLLTKRGDGSILLEEGAHRFEVRVEDFFGNASILEGELRMIPSSGMRGEAAENAAPHGMDPVDSTGTGISLTRHVFEDYIRFGVSAPFPFEDRPYLLISWNGWEREHVPLHRLNPSAFAGVLAWGDHGEGVLGMEVIYHPREGVEQVVRDTVRVVRIGIEGGSLVSEDGFCRADFSGGDVYRPVIGYLVEEPCRHPDGVLDRCYAVHPQDVPLKSGVDVRLAVPAYGGEPEKLGIYTIAPDGSTGYLGGAWEDGRLRARVGSLARYSVLRDTVAPVILSIQPEDGARIEDDTPLVSVTFADSLSGVGGEENYRIRLDGRPLIVEYLPSKDRGIHLVETPLDTGEHVLEILIRDRAGNTAERRSLFSVVR